MEFWIWVRGVDGWRWGLVLGGWGRLGRRGKVMGIWVREEWVGRFGMKDLIGRF